MRPFRTLRLSLIAPAILLGLFAASCATVTMGRDFSTQGVTEGVKPGETSMETVMAVLGQPRSRGKGYIPGHGPVDIWTYLYMSAVAGQPDSIKDKQLLVFFDRERKVAGYLWWSGF